MKITNRRVNALEHVVIPRIIYVRDYIKQELEQRATADKYIIKKILQVKAKHFEEEKRRAGKLEEVTQAPVFEDFDEEDGVEKESKEDRFF